MDTSRIEELLEALIDKQIELISRIDALEFSISTDISNVTGELESLNISLSEANSDISDLKTAAAGIYNELNWWGVDPSFAKQLLLALEK